MVITADAKVRDLLVTFRMTAEVVSVLIGNLIQGQIVARLSDNPSSAYLISGIIFSGVILTTGFVVFFGVRHGAKKNSSGKGKKDVLTLSLSRK